MIDFFKADDRRSRGPLEAPQHGLDAGHQLTGSERLGDVIVRAQLQAKNAIVFARAGGEENDGNRGKAGMATQTAAHIETISAGNHDVEKKQRRRLPLCVGNEIGRSVKEAG